MSGWDGREMGGSGTEEQKNKERSGIGIPEVYMRDPTVLVSLHGRASSRLASASFLRPGAGERVRLVTDRRKKPYSRVEGEARSPYQEIVPRFEIITRRF